MASERPSEAVLQQYKTQYDQDGYVLVPGLFSQAEIQHYRDHYMRLREAGSHPGDFAGVELTSSDPLKRYPRMIHMHRWDETSLH